MNWPREIIACREEIEMEDDKIAASKLLILLFEKLLKEYLLLNRIIYKTKNQFRRQSVFKLINELQKKISVSGIQNFRMWYDKKKDNCKDSNKKRLWWILYFCEGNFYKWLFDLIFEKIKTIKGKVNKFEVAFICE